MAKARAEVARGLLSADRKRTFKTTPFRAKRLLLVEPHWPRTGAVKWERTESGLGNRVHENDCKIIRRTKRRGKVLAAPRGGAKGAMDLDKHA